MDGVNPNGTTTWNADETDLINNYVQAFLVQTAYFNAMPQLMYRTMNNGIVEGTMANATAVDIETMKYLRNVQKSRADFYLQRLMDYLITGRGQNKFPQYLNASTLDGMIPDRVQKYNNGIYLRNSTRKGWSVRDMQAAGIQPYSERAANFWPNCPDCL